ncbi:MAG: hypothetical protein M1815_004290 [Lichina confinis]|nr:MAG: hypothetical protein M1815_004290 [Lichina confinis]
MPRIFVASLLLSLWCASSVWAAPTSLSLSSSEKHLKGRSFILPRFEYPNYVRDGSVAVRQTFGKFGWHIPHAMPGELPFEVDNETDASDAVRVAAASGFLPGETQFLVPVTIGGQALAMNLDTGSSDLWVFSSLLPSSQVNGHTLFDPAKSPTFEEVDGASFSIRYGDQSSASGVVGKDTVDVGGVEVQGQAVELATRVSGSFTEDFNSDGLMGLGFSEINQVKPQRETTFFDNVMPTLAEPLFTAALKRGESGSYEFGNVDESKFTGPLNFVKIDASQGWWQIDTPGVTVGGQTISTPNASPSIADTGTSILLMDNEVVEGYYAQVEGARFDQTQGGFVYPCDSEMPDFGIIISESYTANIPGSLMTFNRLGRGSDRCFGSLQSNEGHPVQILGDTFFNAQFVVFDGGNQQLGFAPHA